MQYCTKKVYAVFTLQPWSSSVSSWIAYNKIPLCGETRIVHGLTRKQYYYETARLVPLWPCLIFRGRGGLQSCWFAIVSSREKGVVKLSDFPINALALTRWKYFAVAKLRGALEADFRVLGSYLFPNAAFTIAFSSSELGVHRYWSWSRFSANLCRA